MMSLNQPPPTFAWPLISVIVPIYNGAADLPDLGQCLFQQTYPKHRVEFLLVDNNSTDDTVVHLQHFRATAHAQGWQVRLLAEPNIQSSYAARNQGIQVAKGEILVFTDADCRPQQDWLTTLIQPFKEAQVGLVIGEITALPGHTLLEHYAEYRETLSQRYTYNHQFCPYGQTANLAVRKAAFEQVGLFRPYLTTGGDADLCWRVQLQADWQVYFEPAAIVQHRHRATFRDLASQWRRYGRSNQYLHELHQVELGPSIANSNVVRRLTRWLVKDLPKATWQVWRGQEPAVALVSVPLDIYCARARSLGQQQAKLPLAAREIAWLADANSGSAIESRPEADYSP